MGGIADKCLERNNNKVQEDGLHDGAAPTLEIVSYLDNVPTQLLCAQINRRGRFDAGRKQTTDPSGPNDLDLASPTDFKTPSGLVSFEYTVDGNVIFQAKKVGAKNWHPSYTVADGTPLHKEQKVLVIAPGKDTKITCVLIDGEQGDYKIDFSFTWPKLKRTTTKYHRAAASLEDEKPEKPEKPEQETLPYEAEGGKVPDTKLDSEATTPRDAGASASGASGASGFQYKVDTAEVPQAAWMTPFKAFVSDQANAETVGQWKSDAELHAAAAETKKVFAGMCLAFVMKQFKVAMTDAAVASAVEARMQAHNENLTKPPTKKEKKEAAEEAAEEEKRKSKKGKGMKRTAGKQRKPAGKKKKGGASDKKKKAAASDSSSSYQDSSDTD
jgi:hypothetical protein